MNTEPIPPCEFLPWDTEFFGHRIGRVHGDTLNDELASSIDKWAADNSVQTLYFLARSNDPTTTRTAESHGYSLNDIRMTFERTIRPEDPGLLGADSEVPIRAVLPEDVGGLQEMARKGHDRTRFANDPHFSRERVQAFYATWITLECQGRAQHVLVASGKGGPMGYISCHLSANGVGQIGLVGVSEKFRGNGIGFKLVRAALSWFGSHGARQVIVVTQGNNKGAQRLYQKCGFVTQDVQFWYHKWFS
ncbi:MAG TPA: GNAT family N-acetyltransferase [Verrucomicrobiae bacterium]